MDGPWTQYQPAAAPAAESEAAPPPWTLYKPAPAAAAPEPAPTPAAIPPGLTGNNRTDWRRLPMAQKDEGTDSPPVDAPGFTDEAPSADLAGPSAPRFGTYGPQPQSQFRSDMNAASQQMIAGAGQGIRGAGQIVKSDEQTQAAKDLALRNGDATRLAGPQSIRANLDAARQTPDQQAAGIAADKATLADNSPAPGAQTGQGIIDYAKQAYPVAEQNQGLQTRVAGLIGGAVPMIGAAAAGSALAGPVGAAAMASTIAFPQAYDGTYQDAISKGAAPEVANRAALDSAAAQTALMSAPIGRLFQAIPAPVKDGLVQTLVNLGKHGIEFGSTTAMSQFAQNYVAKNTYDPNRNYTDGVGDAALEGTLAGIIVPTAVGAARAAGDAIRAGTAPAMSPEYAAAVSTLRQLAGQPTKPPAQLPPPEAPPAAPPPAPETPPPAPPAAPPAPPPEQPGQNQAAQPAPAGAPPPAATSADQPFTMLRPSDLKQDPQRFQYKASDDKGVTGALAGVKKWEPALADPVTAYRDTDGQLYVVNGHQRLDLAQRAEAAGQPDVQIPSRIYDAKDGYSPEFMRTLGAYQNIAQGSGTAIDAAKVLRNSPPGMVPPALPPQSALVQQAQGLRNLSDEAFGAVANGVVPAAYGAEVGAAIKDPQQQMAGIALLHKLAPENVEQARIMVQDIRNSGFLAGSQTGLFGEEQFQQSLFGERAAVLAGALKNLRGTRSVFKAAVTGEGALTAAGNQMDTAANQQGQTANERLLDTLQRDATTRGPLSDALSNAARAVAGGKQVRGAVADFLTQARAIAAGHAPSGVERGAPDGGSGPAPAAEAPAAGPAPVAAPPAEPEPPGLFDPPAPAPAASSPPPPAPVPAQTEADAATLTAPSAPTKAKPDKTGQNSTPRDPNKDAAGRAMIGVNHLGRPLWEDALGVRSYMDNGARISEPVHIRPTREGGVEAVLDRANRPAEFRTREELAQEASDGIQGTIPASDAQPGAADVQRTAPVGDDGQASGPSGQEGERDAAGPSGAGAAGPGGESGGPERQEIGGGGGEGDADRLPDAIEGPAPGAAERPADEDESNVQGTDLRLAPGEIEEGRGPALKARDNLAAVRLAKEIAAQDRIATRPEQVTLAKFVGWGGLSKAFPDPKTGTYGKGMEKVGAELARILTPEEHATAARSTQYAHYTAEPVIRAMWGAVSNMGFQGGMVFEPGMGVGHFLGMMPPDIAERSQYQGIEMDHLTADIAKLIYPQSGVRQADYIKTPMPEDAFDLVIGNPPFADIVIKADPKYTARGFLLHDYFFAKSLDSVRPGGLLAFITSAGTMNKLDTKAREYLAERAEFLGGIRLPSNAFAKNAGTEVTTDILFLKRRAEGRVPLADAGDTSWTETVQRTLPNASGGQDTGNVSRYFSEHPEMVLGEEGFFDKLYKGRYGVHARPGQDFEADLAGAMARLPRDVMDAPLSAEQRAALDFGSGQKKDGSFYIDPRRGLMQYSGGAGRPLNMRGGSAEEGKTFTKAEVERITDLVPIRDALRDVFQHDLAGNDAEAAKARAALNATYDAFVAKYGPINKGEFTFRRPSQDQVDRAWLQAREDARDVGDAFDDGDFDPSPMLEANAKTADIIKARQAARKAAGDKFNEGTFDPTDMPDVVTEKRPNIKPFMGDPESYRLRSIEEYNDTTGHAEKKAIFSRSVISREQEPQISSVEDGVLWSLNKIGRLDVDAIAGKMSMSRQAVVDRLGSRIFQVPGTRDTYQTADEYLSGDVVSKLEQARAAAGKNPAMERNVTALEKALPPPLPPSDISMALGMPWIPTDIQEQFASEHLRLGPTTVVHIPNLGIWRAEPGVRGGGEDRSGMARWSVTDRTAHQLLSDAMNRTPPRIYQWVRVNGEKKQVFDAEQTQRAQDMVDAMKAEFADWVEADPARHDQLADLYNTRLNRVVLRKYDGSYLTTPGIVGTWSWRPHQTRVVSRIVLSGNTYMAHAVGAGKTSAMIGAGMEMRRLGLVRKPMYAVPNHMLGQFTKEFYEQYPTARIAVADEMRFHTDTRKQFVANVAQDDLDAVIITHSGFGKIPISDTFQAHLVHEELDRLEESLSGLDPVNDRITVKKLQNAKQKLEQKLSKAGASNQDQTITFEEMGVDFVFVDEAHMFRKLSFATKQGNLKGVTSEGSGMAWDLYSKVRYLESKNPGRSAVLASGTPVTNTMGELYTLSRYMQPGALESRGISHFDSWSQTFGDTKSDLEPQPDGSYKPVTRFSRFVNMPELYKMVGSIMDIVTPAQLEQYVVRPKLAGGERKLHMAPFTPELAAYQASLGARMEAIAKRKGPPKPGDDILLSVINDGRHAAIDPRFVMATSDPNAPSKLNELIGNVFDIWKATKSHQFYEPKSGYKDKAFKGPATQMIFCNMGVNGRGPLGFSAYAWIRASLQRKGVPPAEIAFIGDYVGYLKRQALFNDVNEGKVRILVGSVQKMGTGVNAQRRLIAIHNADPLWYPSDDEQRNGRGIRQGNYNPEIQIHDYTTTDTYDRTMWGMMGRKGRFIEQFFRGDPELRDMEDLGEAGVFEQAAAMATSDPRAMHLTQMKQDLQKAERRRSAHDRNQYDLRGRVTGAEATIARIQKAEKLVQKDIAQRKDTRGDAFTMRVGDKNYSKRKDAAAALAKEVNTVLLTASINTAIDVGEVGGFPLFVVNQGGGHGAAFGLRMNGDREMELAGGSETTMAGVIQSAETNLRGLELTHAEQLKRIENERESIANMKPLIGQPFKGGEEIAKLRQQVADLEEQLNPKKAPTPVKSGVEEGGEDASQSIRAAGQAGSSQPAADAQAHMAALMESVMRYAGVPPSVGVKLVDAIRLKNATADAYYSPTKGLITFAMDTPPDEVPHKLTHEIIHVLADPKLGLLTATERRALDVAGDKWLAQRGAGGKTNRDHLLALGYPEEKLREEAAARLAEAALETARRQSPGLIRALHSIVNLVTATGQALRGDGFTTADDVFRSIMQGKRAPAGGAGQLANTTAAAGQGLQPVAKPAAPAKPPAAAPPVAQKPGSFADQVASTAALTPEDYRFSRRPPVPPRDATPDLLGGGLPRAARATQSTQQQEMFGGDSAVQAQAARDAQGRGALQSSAAQTKLDDGLFAPDPKAQKAMFSLRGPMQREVVGAFQAIRDRTYNAYREVADSLFPMRAGSAMAQSAAAGFANALRGITYRYGKLDAMLVHDFTPAQRSDMGRALDAQSVFEQQLRGDLEAMDEADRPEYARLSRSSFDDSGTGLAGLPAPARAAVESLNELSRLTWNRMQQREIVQPNAQGLDYYMPRQFVTVDSDNVSRLRKPGPSGGSGAAGPGVNGFHEFGRNLNTSGPRRRNYLTPEESLEAARALFGDNTELVTDIRSLLVALARNERAIAGRDLIDAIREYGEAAHEDWVVEGNNPDPRQFFTLADHPSLWRWRIRMAAGEDGKVAPAQNADGEPIFDRVPVHISKDFKGPLSAVLTQKSPSWYQGLMAIKGVGMHAIMFSPFMHLAVEIGRALPAMPSKVLTGRVFVDGHRGLSNDAYMAQAIRDGLAPIAQRWSQDPASIADDNLNPHGRNKVTRALGAANDAVARNIERYLGSFAGSVVRAPHEALLWRNVLKLQVGIYKNARDEFMRKGFPERPAGIMAAHVANRYAGALPPEHLHRGANMAANLLLFSRSFTLGNLGVMKDALKGAPPHVLAAISTARGDVPAAKKALARKAQGAVLLDIGLFMLGTALTQSAFHVAHNSAQMGFVGAAAHAYEDWQHKAGLALRSTIGGNPLAIVGLLPQHWNEPGKQDRVYIGNDNGGRGEYVRLMTGKVGEEMLGWLTKPGTMLANKENPMLSGLEDIIRGEDHFGRPIMPPDPQTMGDYLHNAGLVMGHLLGGMLPLGPLQDVKDIVTGPNRGEAATRFGMQMTGLGQVSKGFPGGPAEGVEFATRKREDFMRDQIMPAARRMLEAGNADGAEKAIELSSMTDYDKMQALRSLRSTGSARAMALRDRHFLRSSTEGDRLARDNVTATPAPP